MFYNCSFNTSFQCNYIRARNLHTVNSQHDVDGSENVIWKCNFTILNYFSTIQSYCTCKICCNFPGNKLEQDLQKYADKIEHLSSRLRCPHSCKTSLFTSSRERERLKNVQKWKVHVQSVKNYCFSLSNMQICDVLAVVVLVVASAP